MSQHQILPSHNDHDDTLILENPHPKPIQQKRDMHTHTQHKMHHKINNSKQKKTANDFWFLLLEILSMATGAVLAALALCEYILKPLWHLIKM